MGNVCIRAEKVAVVVPEKELTQTPPPRKSLHVGLPEGYEPFSPPVKPLQATNVYC